jgi:hypothetical protein
VITRQYEFAAVNQWMLEMEILETSLCAYLAKRLSLSLTEAEET